MVGAMRWLIGALALTLAAGLGCDKEKPAHQGLPPASDWQAPSPMASEVGGAEAVGHGGAAQGANPHAGMDMSGAGGANPHAGMDMSGMGGADPHAGMDMGGGADPHGGMDVDPAMAAIQPPDPSRPIDKSRFLGGQIVSTEKTASLIKPGAIMFLSVRPVNPATGEIIGTPVAVDRIDISELPASFRLTEANAMAAGTTFQGAVLIQARVDGDGEARTKSPGDVTGEVRATIPADDLELRLDTVLQ